MDHMDQCRSNNWELKPVNFGSTRRYRRILTLGNSYCKIRKWSCSPHLLHVFSIRYYSKFRYPCCVKSELHISMKVNRRGNINQSIPGSTDYDVDFVFFAFVIDEAFGCNSLHLLGEGCDIWQSKSFEESITRLSAI